MIATDKIMVVSFIEGGGGFAWSYSLLRLVVDLFLWL